MVELSNEVVGAVGETDALSVTVPWKPPSGRMVIRFVLEFPASISAESQLVNTSKSEVPTGVTLTAIAVVCESDPLDAETMTV